MSFNKAQSISEPSTRIIVLGKDGAVKLSEEGLRKWFQSKSKDGKSGWVDVVDGDACAREKGETATPKCVSSAKRASMSPAERKAAQAAKRREDPNQPSKSGGAKPTYVRTDRKKVKKESYLDERSLSKGETKEKERLVKGMKKSYKDFKARYGEDAKSVMYATATKMAKEEKDHEVSMAQSQLSSAEKDIKALKKKLGKKEKNIPAWMQAKITDTEHNMDAAAGYVTKEETESLDEKCWKGYTQKGMKKKGKKIVPNCVPIGEEKDKPGSGSGKKDACYHKVKASAKVWPSAYASGRLVQCRKKGASNYGNSTKKESYVLKPFSSFLEEGAAWTKKEGQNSSGGLNEKGRKSYERENPGSDLKAPSKKVGNPRRASFCARMKGMRKRQKPENNTGDDRLSKSLKAWNC
jgi:hypothetical protein